MAKSSSDPKNEGSPAERKVFISSRESKCDECHEELGSGAWISLAGERGALCLECAELDHLEFLPSGSAALTRRAKSHSRLWAVVLKWSRARKRYERQGLLVEEDALARAEAECLSDEDARRARRERNAERLVELDTAYVRQFAERVRERYPGPPERAQSLSEHACRKYSGRIGRSAAAKRFDDPAIDLAVIAHLRHTATNYDELLGRGCERDEARRRVAAKLEKVLETWRAGP